MSTDFLQIDAFTQQPFTGNPAAVCVLENPADDAWMQNVAQEMNLSETAFLYPEAQDWRLRWFTPLTEVDLCGHATLASTHALVTEHEVDPTEIRFHTRSGVLLASSGSDGTITLDFPSDPPASATPPPGLLESLGVDVVAVARGVTDYLVEVADAETVRALNPEMGGLAQVDMRGLMVTARNERAGFDFVSRFFAPGTGVPEDPVTGSAHTTLTPWWSAKLDKTSMRAEQASRRGGVIDVELVGDRVRLTGHAVTVARGQLLV